ncbi:MAG: ABC transporter permease [Martelella sp.]|uniref:Inner membrane ABC transporter permease protein YdcV n=1 Tax=Martelella mediterranea DSM 17316 TaxID=1122214 RepID=A0A1U9YVT9_9HYPH|nr:MULTISPECIES: ABC transporter permease [Martelella]AQZ49549.1 Inner membrane ABC transporter permease protein YdcV [Martelella mediterranea DSM 17316]MAU23249.1 ABC transporter permease [Martelella sp.]|tara:strand:- start:1075 stop:1887 length:813 start_codon:yes stop_codon:yes gene_type:complete
MISSHLLSKSVLSALIVIAYAVILAPVVTVVAISFFDQGIISFPPDGLTLRWFVNAWARREFTQGLIMSLELALIATAIGVPLGTLAAYGLNRGRFRGKGVISTLLLGPLAVPAIIMGTALYIFYIRAEAIIDQTIVGTTAGLVAAHVLLTIPWTVRLVAASMEGVDLRVEEAAANLGAPPVVVAWRITLPMLRSGIVAASMFSFIQSFENLELSLLLIGPGKITLPVAMLNYLEFKIDPTLAAVGTIQILLIGVLMLVTDRYVKLSRVL